MRFLLLLGLAALPLALATGCHRNPEKILASPGVRGRPDILKEIAADPHSPWKAFRLRAYHINQVWAGDGFEPDGDKWANFRGKVTVWETVENPDGDPEEPETALAELYFRDANQYDPAKHKNPDPNNPKDPNNINAQGTGPGRTYRIHFPSAAMGIVSSILRNANEPVYLFWYHNQWAIGVANGETVGVD